MNNTILITGGTGLIGSRLSYLLREQGYGVRHLSRRRNTSAEFPAYRWDIDQNYIDPDAIDSKVSTIVHLAGASIADCRWTTSRKAELLSSRTRGIALLSTYLREQPQHQVRTFIGGSATGYYGNSGDRPMTENDPPADDSFLSQTTQAWEQAYAPLDQVRRVVLRIGVVLSAAGGALPQMALAARWGLATYFGKGRQYVPWIHIDDLCALLLYVIANPAVEGTYNAVAPQAITNAELMHILAQTLSGRAWNVPIPAAVLRLGMGEMADVVLHGCRATSDKICQAGFVFLYPELREAVRNLFVV